MTTIHREAVVKYDAESMFRLVNDIEAYPAFLPWCEGARILRQDEDEVEATLDIQHGPLRKAFTTCNRLQPNKLIQMKLVKGPFRHLNGIWRFESLDHAGSRISLDLDFEFSTPLLSLTLGPVFNHIGKTLLEAFCQRATQVYG
ncbi:MAG: type II toxin-antitoxin system RatA family toxin [Gammaproteobacteria bacterium]|nr:MAG: type II toxin-antitoxin system RatA family toxin [Gammaproteobacteria bacterium]